MKRQAESTSDATVEPYHFSKDKLPKALSYPLKRYLLDAALHSASVYGAVYAVLYSGDREANVILRAQFSPEQYGSIDPGRCLIVLFAVPCGQRKATERVLIVDGLPTLCAWLQKTQTEGNVYRGSSHELVLTLDDSVLRTYEF
jgi:hypothetical protein